MLKERLSKGTLGILKVEEPVEVVEVVGEMSTW